MNRSKPLPGRLLPDLAPLLACSFQLQGFDPQQTR